MDHFQPYIVSGCGVSMICDTRKAVLEWSEYILARGAWPDIKPYIRGVNHANGTGKSAGVGLGKLD